MVDVRTSERVDRTLFVPIGEQNLPAHLRIPANASGVVLFAHGSGSSRFSPRNVQVAQYLNDRGIGTLLFDLLTPSEAAVRMNVFDVSLLTNRLAGVAAWIRGTKELSDVNVPLGFFGASTGGAAAIAAAAMYPRAVAAVVCRGGRPDLVKPLLDKLQVPTTLIVGGRDTDVLRLNREAAEKMRCPVDIVVVPGAGHLFEEPGTMDEVCRVTADAFTEAFRAVSVQEPRVWV